MRPVACLQQESWIRFSGHPTLPYRREKKKWLSSPLVHSHLSQKAENFPILTRVRTWENYQKFWKVDSGFVHLDRRNVLKTEMRETWTEAWKKSKKTLFGLLSSEKGRPLGSISAKSYARFTRFGLCRNERTPPFLEIAGHVLTYVYIQYYNYFNFWPLGGVQFKPFNSVKTWTVCKPITLRTSTDHATNAEL